MERRDSLMGRIALVGPMHSTQISEFQYVEVTGLNGDKAKVKLVGPDFEANAPMFDMEADVLQRRLVSSDEREHWPGTFLAHPVAFIGTNGDGVEEWSYGVVTGYSMEGTSASLRLASPTGPEIVKLAGSDNIIKADTLNYVLQTGKGVNSMAMSAPELVDEQNQVIAACGTRRRAVPPAVMSKLTVAWDGSALIPFVRPTDLKLVRVRRQHALDCVMGPRTRRPESLYIDPEACSIASSAKADTPNHSRHSSTVSHDIEQPARTRLLHPAEDTASLSISDEDADSDVRSVQQLNEPLRKRIRLNEEASSIGSAPNELNRLRRRQDIVTDHEIDIHRLVVHPKHQGKHAQSLLQCVQQSPHVSFLATPAVLRALYSFGFGAGLFLMHMRRTTPMDMLEASEKCVNMIDFNSRQAPPAPARVTSHDDVVSALNALHKFARHFYNDTVVELVDTARSFVLSYREYNEPELELSKFLAIWVTKKFSRFRSLLLAEGIEEAMSVAREFKRSDDELVAWREAYLSRQSKVSVHGGRNKQQTVNYGQQRGQRGGNYVRITQDLIGKLPSQGGKRLCMKFLSKVGCNYDGCERGHFRPTSLPQEAKTAIAARWQGLATEYQDLL